MSDLSKLSDAELEALSRGDMSKLSDASLQALVGGEAAETPALPATEPAKARPARLGAEGGMMAGMVPGETVAGAAQAARYGVPLLGSTGGLPGVIFSAGGEKLAQSIEGSDDPSAVTRAAIMGAPTLGGARGVWAGIKEALKLGGAGLAAEQIGTLQKNAQATGEIKPSGLTESGAATVLPAILSMLGRGVGLATSGKATPEELARVARVANEEQPTRAKMIDLIQSGGAVPPADARFALGGRSGMVESLGQSLAGKEFLQQQASMVNEPVLRGMVRSDIGLPAEGRLGASAIEAVKQRAAIPYKEFSGISDQASELMQNWKRVRDERRALQNALDSGTVPPANSVDVRAKIQELGESKQKMESLIDAYSHTIDGTPEAAKISAMLGRYEDRVAGAAMNKGRYEARQASDVLDSTMPRAEQTPITQFKSDRVNLQTPDMADNPAMRDVLDEADRRMYVQKSRTADSIKRRLDETVKKRGKSELSQNIDRSKVLYAKANDLEDAGAVSYGREKLNPQALANFLDTAIGGKMTGGMRRAALIADTLPKITQDVSRIGTPNVSRLNALVAGSQAAEGVATADPIRVASAAWPVLGEKARDYYLGQNVQQKILKALQEGPKPETPADPVITAIIQRLMLQEEAARNRQ